MSDKTGIEWTQSDDGTPGATWNPVTGCDDVSPGCQHCYARTFAERWRGTPGHHFERGFDVVLRPERLDQPLRWKRPRRIFVNSMSDLFHKDVPDEYIARVFAVMAMASQHTFLILTKRHARMRSFLQDDCRCGKGHVPGVHLRSAMDWAGTKHSPTYVPGVIGGEVYHHRPWPLPNVWVGVSAENQKWADIRVPALLATPAAVRFISAEPLLGPVDLIGKPWLGCEDAGPAIVHNGYSTRTGYGTGEEHDCSHEAGIDWVIAGGESGPGARPMHPDWARSLRDQCTASEVPYFFKQWGEWGPAPWRVGREPGEGEADYKKRAEAVCATHAYALWADRYGHEPHKPGHQPWSGERTSLPEWQAPIRRWGKGRAGRELDGREWSQFPRVTEMTGAA